MANNNDARHEDHRPHPGYLCVPQLARRFGKNQDTIRRWFREGRLPFFRIGTSYLVRIDDLEAFEATLLSPAQPVPPRTGAGRPHTLEPVHVSNGVERDQDGTAIPGYQGELIEHGVIELPRRVCLGCGERVPINHTCNVHFVPDELVGV